MTWENFKHWTNYFSKPEFSLNLSCAALSMQRFEELKAPMEGAFKAMQALETGAIANPNEHRRVGHFWLRAPSFAPNNDIQEAIYSVLERLKTFSNSILNEKTLGQAGPFKNVLCIGIGGSSLGPYLLLHALQSPKSKLKFYFLDNTDPQGFDDVFAQLEGQWGQTLVITTSKSGSTPEPRNALIETQAKYQGAKIDFPPHAVAITCKDSLLDRLAIKEQWLARFPMWDWVGGRFSITSVVGLLPAALAEINFEGFLQGAQEMDQLTRVWQLEKNPAALLAAAWYILGEGKGNRHMVLLPYNDRLSPLTRYLQQLLMESLGKAYTINGKLVNQGLTVYGNKGSTDQHAFIQQLREGRNDFFVHFIEFLEKRTQVSIEVEKGIYSGDFLNGFYLGTREALRENHRPTLSINFPRLNAYTLGALIALYERTVGLYASLIQINAYHQPGVEAGKKAADEVLKLQIQLLKILEQENQAFTASDLAQKLHRPEKTELIFKILEHLSYNHPKVTSQRSGSYFDTQYRWKD